VSAKDKPQPAPEEEWKRTLDELKRTAEEWSRKLDESVSNLQKVLEEIAPKPKTEEKKAR